jgi:ribosomal protein L29
MTEKTLLQLQQELIKLRLDLKANKVKDTSQFKKIKKQIARFKTKI